MASAILSSRNGPNSSDFTSKFTNRSNLNFSRLQNIICPNPNSTPNPNSSHFCIGNNSRDVHWKSLQQLPSCAHPEATFMGSSINSVPANSYGYRYITFRIGSYTRRELKGLKRRLISDLERVRVLRRRICSTSIPKKNYHPPQLQLPAAPVVDLTVKEQPKSAVGQKRMKSSSSVRETKKQGGRVKNNAQRSNVVMRKCGQILGKLMKHKHGWVFNNPVDASALKLYDYHKIITNPMDLGTVKSKLAKNEYESPLAFASDVRLTFENAMVYNGKGSEVFVMAERLLLLFESMLNPTQPKKQNPSPKIPIDNPAVKEENPPRKPEHPSSTLTTTKMTPQEKSELAAGLLNLQLGPEGMDQIIAIIKKGVLGLEQEADELELDLGVLDDETLWELKSFIGSSRKKVSSVHSHQSTEGGEEDIDIGDEIPVTNFPFVEIEKDGSSSSSSSSGSDSSSDSGSEEGK